MAEWVRALDWRPGGPGFESRCGNLFASELWKFCLHRFASQCLSEETLKLSRHAVPSISVSGVYAMGSKISHTCGKCVGLTCRGLHHPLKYQILLFKVSVTNDKR